MQEQENEKRNIMEEKIKESGTICYSRKHFFHFIVCFFLKCKKKGDNEDKSQAVDERESLFSSSFFFFFFAFFVCKCKVMQRFDTEEQYLDCL